MSTEPPNTPESITDTAPRVERQPEPGGDILALCTISRPDHADEFTLYAQDASTRSAEEWVRAALETSAGVEKHLIWRGILRLHLRWRKSPDHVAGWIIGHRDHHGIRLEAHSRWITANIVVHTRADRMSLSTIVRFDRPMGGRLWRKLAGVHNSVVPGLLRSTHRVLFPPSVG